MKRSAIGIRLKRDPYVWVFYLGCVIVAAYLVRTSALPASEVGAFLAAAAFMPALVERRRGVVDFAPDAMLDVKSRGTTQADPTGSADAEQAERSASPPSSP